MQKFKIIPIVLCIVILASGTTAFAADSVTAVKSPQRIYVDGQPVDMLAYSINDNNYIRLREIGKAINCNIFYDASTDSVRIDRTRPYIGGDTEELPMPGDSVTAVLSTQQIYVYGVPVRMTAYLIADNNYTRLRDFGSAVNLGLAYDPAANAVYIDTQTAYLPDMTPELLRPEAIPGQSPSEPTAEPGKTLITEKVLDGSEWAREDFSQAANPAIFDDVFTRAAYNAIRQSIVDRDIILADNNADGYNLYYRYGNFIDRNYTTIKPGETYTAMNKVVWTFNGYYQFILGIEPYVKNRYEYPGYSICKATTHEFYAPANQATDAFISEIKALSSDRDKVKRINDYVCDNMNYGDGQVTSVNTIFSSATPVLGTCGDYSDAINYLCQRAGIPCVMIVSETHGWNEVFVDGKWLVLDATANDIDPPNYNVIYLVETHPDYTDLYPKHTAFAKNLLVPGNDK